MCVCVCVCVCVYLSVSISISACLGQVNDISNFIWEDKGA